MTIRTRLILDEFARHRVQFEYLCHDLTATELASPIPGAPWTVRDYIAHLCTIDGLIAPNFSRMVGLTAPLPDTAIPDPFDIDDWNEAAVSARSGVSITDLLAEGARHRDNLAAAIALMTDAQLDAIIPYGGDRKTLNLPKSMIRFGGLLWGIAIHEPTHTVDILKALPHRREQSWIREWLDSVSDKQVPQGAKDQRV